MNLPIPPGGVGLAKPPGKISGGKSFLVSVTGVRLRNIQSKTATSLVVIIFYIER
jgi:hypothetical protein